MIRYFNRVTQKIETETVYGDLFIKFAYANRVGFFLTDFLFSKKWLSRLMGAYEDSHASASKIPEFIQKYQIKMEEYESTIYRNFNDFFIRKFKPGARNFDPTETTFCAGAEARYLAFENIQMNQRFGVKGFEINLPELLRSQNLAETFDGGTFIIARLCPVDYHRFHFPTAGRALQYFRIQGGLHSVNPAAFTSAPKVFLENQREVTLFENSAFGKIAMIEVGALGVGKIVQSSISHHNESSQIFDKGQEKGYFLFGGSTVIWLIQKGKIKISTDLQTNSLQDLETWIPLGSSLGEVKR